MKKKILSVLSIALIFAILGAFAACGGNEGTTTTTGGATTTEAPKSDLKILPDALEGSTETYVVGFRKGDQALRDKIQTILCEMKKDGVMAQISTTWFGSDMTTVKETADIKTEATDDSLKKVLEDKKLIVGLD
ncbi:MAG: transporter substrate-binding domain-containing protein, partial [Clostridiales bacterium]|nr:transporter substrate-binding domain-containing protein [Clostridiales bacterium]